MRNIFLFVPVMAVTIAANVGCTNVVIGSLLNRSLPKVPKVKKHEPVKAPSFSWQMPELPVLDFKDRGCNKSDPEIPISAEAQANVIQLNEKSQSQEVEWLGCNGELIDTIVRPLSFVQKEIPVTFDFPRRSEVRFVEVENLRSCQIMRIDVDATDEMVRKKGEENIPISRYRSDTGLTLAIEELDPLFIGLGVGAIIGNRTHVIEGTNLIQVRYMGECKVWKDKTDPSATIAQNCAEAETLATHEFRLDLKIERELLPGKNSLVVCAKAKGN